MVFTKAWWFMMAETAARNGSVWTREGLRSRHWERVEAFCRRKAENASFR